jgi:hypothetical protein
MKDIISETIFSSNASVVNMSAELIEELNKHPSLAEILSSIAENCNFVITCNIPLKTIKQLLTVTHEKCKSILVNLTEDSYVSGLGTTLCMYIPEWIIDISTTDYKKCLREICSKSGLQKLTINIVGMKEGEEHSFDIDSIKQIININEIHFTIKFQFPLSAFSHITNNIDRVTIVMGPNPGKHYKPCHTMSFTNNERLIIDGFYIKWFTTLNFSNVYTLMLENTRREGLTINDYRVITYPSSVKFGDRAGQMVFVFRH